MDGERDESARPARAGKPRARLCPGRPRAVLVRLSEAERALIVDAAGRAGLTPTGFVALAALAAASESVEVVEGGPLAVGVVEGLRGILREVFAARRAVVLFESRVQEVAEVVRATGRVPVWAESAVVVCAGAVAELDAVAGVLERWLR